MTSSTLGPLDKVQCRQIFAIFVYIECGEMAPLICVALMLGLPVAVNCDQELLNHLWTYFMATVAVPAGSWLVFATIAANSF